MKVSACTEFFMCLKFSMPPPTTQLITAPTSIVILNISAGMGRHYTHMCHMKTKYVNHCRIVSTYVCLLRKMIPLCLGLSLPLLYHSVAE